ncbi:MAG TPA: DUF5320 domain-containing protein [Bacteroidales bacterium]|nr:DUF5320 domain-containing protein [Bacteroidales bacterium]
MPNFNRKGPNNEGPRTGRGLGKCNPTDSENPPFNRFGCGMNRRLRFRFRNRFNQSQND